MVVVGRDLGVQWKVQDLTTVVHGMDGAAAAVLARLQSQLPGEINLLERELALPAGTLSSGEWPLVPAYYGIGNRERLEPDQFPAVLAVPSEVPLVRRTDITEAGELAFHIEYSLRIWFYARNESFETTEATRNRLALVIRRALLRRGILAENARLEMTAYREAYGDVVPARDSRSLTGGTIDVRVITDEELPPTITAGSPNSANTIAVDQTILP